MKTGLYRNSFTYKLILFFMLALLVSSCKSSKSLVYNPKEVTHLSGKMGFAIDNRDENIPLYAEVSMWLGVPYRYGGINRKGVDCSGFINRVYLNVYKRNVSRTTSALDKDTHKINKGQLKAGDLVFFATSSKKNKTSHVGIYLKEGYFAHASSSRGVVVNHLEEAYYRRTWKKAGRLK